MREAVATLVAGGQPLTTFGDNLFVDLDLSQTNLPTGNRLCVGEAVGDEVRVLSRASAAHST